METLPDTVADYVLDDVNESVNEVKQIMELANIYGIDYENAIQYPFEFLLQ